MVLLPAACYFSNSRGPWVGCGLAGLAMGTLGGRPMRRKLMLLGALAAVILALRPGTYDTISSLWHQSLNNNTIKGRSADYRLVLWGVAYDELSKSFGHTLLGYGGHSTEMLDMSKYFDQGAGGLPDQLGYTSWDSQYASNFMQYGFLGFGLETILYLSVLGMLVRTWRHSNEEDREFTAVCVATTLVFFWAMATVAIFNPQLEYLFWAMVAIAGRFHSVTSVADLSPELNEDVRMGAPHIQARSEIGI